MTQKTPAGVLALNYCCFLLLSFDPVAYISVPGTDPSDISLDLSLTYI